MGVLWGVEGEFAVSCVGVLLVVDLFAESLVVWYCYAVLFHGEFEVGEDFGFCVLGEFCAFCVCDALVADFFEDWFADSCLVCEEFLEFEALVCSGYGCDYVCVAGLEWEFVCVDEFECVRFALDDCECGVVLEFAQV